MGSIFRPHSDNPEKDYGKEMGAMPGEVTYDEVNTFISRWCDYKPRLEILSQFYPGSPGGLRDLSDGDWFKLLGYQWRDVPNVEDFVPALMEGPFYEIAVAEYCNHKAGLSPREIRRRWSRCASYRQAFMSERGEREAYDGLPGEVTLWRACFEGERDSRLIWYLSQEQAMAGFDASAGELPVLLEARANKEDIAGVKDRRRAHEAVVWQPEIVQVLDIEVSGA